MKRYNALQLFCNKKEWLLFFAIVFLIFIGNISLYFFEYKEFKNEELYNVSAQIINTYPKKEFFIIKAKSDNFTFFTKVEDEKIFKNLDSITVTLITKNIDFIDYLKGFYTNSFNAYLEKSKKERIKIKLHKIIASQHSNEDITQLFNALFLALPLGNKMRNICAVYGISHLIAISGFHLGLICFLIYWILYYPYSIVHQKYFPYRNKKFDILIVTVFVLFSYLIFTNIVPSLLRAFVMFVFGLYLLRFNIKLLSFGTLFIITCIIIAFFPKYIFSLSLWFSLCAVFYIFLFLKYFKTLPKVWLFLFFNIWIYLSFNPIAHYFFGTTSLWQLISPIVTLGFTLFYPIEAFLHLIGFGGVGDFFIEYGINLKIYSYEIFTPSLFFYFYLVVSILSVWYKSCFILLNILFILFNIYLYT